MSYFFRALAFFRPDANRIAGALGLLLLSTGANLLKPWPLALIVDSVLGDKPLPNWMAGWIGHWDQTLLLALLAGSILLFHAAQGALSSWQNFITIQVGLCGLTRVRKRLFSWLQRLSFRFHHGARQGDLIYRASWDTYSFQTLFQQGVFTFATAFLTLVLIMIIMWRVNVPLTLVSLATVPLLVLAMNFFGREMKKRSLAAIDADSQVTSSIQQNIVALPLILSYTREGAEKDQFTGKVQAAFDQRISQHRYEIFYLLAIALVFALGTAAITWLGAKQVMADHLTLGELLVFLFYLAQLYEPLNQLSHLGPTVSEATAGAQRVLDILDAPEEIRESPNPRPVLNPASSIAEAPPVFPQGPPPLVARGNISFENVSFAYVPGRLVLHEISFSVAAGEAVAIIGPSGAGKTSLLQLLPRFYDPDTGAVRLEQADLRELKLKDLREQISLVLQEPILLQATVAENIAYGNPSAGFNEIEAAAQAAHADGFIRSLPRQYETLLGEGGARLSAGEKQRLNLARAFLKDAPILILDEPTSALDAESEALVVESLNQLMRRRTSLLVAHRFSTIKRAHKIVTLEAGRLTEYGAPEELLDQGGYFARLTKLLHG